MIDEGEGGEGSGQELNVQVWVLVQTMIDKRRLSGCLVDDLTKLPWGRVGSTRFNHLDGDHAVCQTGGVTMDSIWRRGQGHKQ